MREFTWEYDYIRHDLLCTIPDLEPEQIDGRTISNLLHRKAEPCIMALCSRTDFNAVSNVVKYLKPYIIFIMWDEWGDKHHWQSLQNHTNLLLRQYNHTKYNYGTNNIHIPLGYASGYLNKQVYTRNIRPIINRSINCTFIGQLKQDRQRMSDAFKAGMEKTNIHFAKTNWSDPEKQTYHPSKLFDIYNDTIFIPNGRGGNLDCYRVYEAIIAGAIPVIVCNKQQALNTFTYYTGKIPLCLCRKLGVGRDLM